MAKNREHEIEIEAETEEESPNQDAKVTTERGGGRPSWTYYSTVWKTFEAEGARKQQTRVLTELKGGIHILAAIADADDLVRVLRDESEPFERKDGILLALISEQQARPRAALLSLLVRALLPALDRVYKSRAFRMNDAADRDDLCSRVLVGFAETVSHYPTASWLTGVAENLRLNTKTRLRATEKSAEREREALSSHEAAADALVSAQERTDDDEQRGLFDEVMVAESEPAPPHPEEIANVRARLDGYVAEGRIKAVDAQLLFDVCALGRAIADVAMEMDIAVETAKKRKSRALADLRSGTKRRRRKTRS